MRCATASPPIRRTQRRTTGPTSPSRQAQAAWPPSGRVRETRLTGFPVKSAVVPASDRRLHLQERDLRPQRVAVDAEGPRRAAHVAGGACHGRRHVFLLEFLLRGLERDALRNQLVDDPLQLPVDRHRHVSSRTPHERSPFGGEKTITGISSRNSFLRRFFYLSSTESPT